MAENTTSARRSNNSFRFFMRDYFNMMKDKDDEAQIVESIRQGVEFKGANLWILIFAIFIASLGLNVNSTAVIIGAMLISPLMGPIIGIGLAVGIHDFELMKRSLRSLGMATLVSVLTATLYFLLSPLNQAQSELLARTSPTIYDVLIALFGGLAGIVALCTKNKGNVLPGVAIATALMPPLCTAGFGLATGNIYYFFGAFYLFFINSVFISLATFFGVRLFKFKAKQFTDKAREKLVGKYIVALVILTLSPALYLTYGIVRQTIYTTAANNFINNNLNFSNTQVIDRVIDPKTRNIRVVLVGAEVPERDIVEARSKLSQYNLTNTSLQVIQGINGDSLDIHNLRSMVLEDFYKNSEAQLEEQRKKIKVLEQNLEGYTRYERLDEHIVPELKVLFPTAQSITMARSVVMKVDSNAPDTVSLVVMEFTRRPNAAETHKLEEWLKARLNTDKLDLVVK